MAGKKQVLGNKTEKVSLIILILNSFLFAIKITGAVLFGSVALLSDAINSLVDIFGSVAVFAGVKESAKAPDKCHPFGHYRAQPLAAFVIAVLTAIFGFEVIKIAIDKILSGKIELVALPAIAILLISMVIKIGMWFLAKKTSKQENSIALEASAIDCRNDVLVDAVAITGIYLASLGQPLFDPIAAIAIGIYVLKSAVDIARENTGYLMGKSPKEEVIKKMKETAAGVKGVVKVNEVKAQYLGVYIQVEVHIGIDKKTNLEEAHKIGHAVEAKLEQIEKVSDCIAHIDPA